MKRGYIFLALILVLTISFVSASFFSNFFGKLTKKANYGSYSIYDNKIVYTKAGGVNPCDDDTHSQIYLKYI